VAQIILGEKFPFVLFFWWTSWRMLQTDGKNYASLFASVTDSYPFTLSSYGV